jgi:hypothetical protein
MGVPKWYINTTNGNKIKINIEYLPLSVAKTLKEVEPVTEAEIPEVLKDKSVIQDLNTDPVRVHKKRR